ncbi:unnamed protein product [Rotaria sordida]|uniref:Uncharacterized protein n=1 Tax=Rotaria sordida TaxID=392033 RepID=A0A815K6J4_9BILA|nr:unnamed protein product [Rotaria sordida]CAF1618681.1 unnamed protein product [Rotaria sordida]
MTQKNVDEYQRAQCIALRKTGMSYHAIGTNAGISRASVQRALERFEETGGFQDHHRCGRLEKQNQQNVCMLKHWAQDDDNRSSAPEIMIEFNKSLEKLTQRRTIINYFQECGFEYKGMCLISELTDDLSTEWLVITLQLREKFVFSMSQWIQKSFAAPGKCIYY